MSKLSQTLPLKTVQTNTISQVRIRVREPLLVKKENRKACQELQLLKQLSHLELILEKMDRLELWKTKGGLRIADATLKKLHEVALNIQLDIRKNPTKNNLLESIRAQKLFSKATRFLFNEAGITLQSEEQQVYELAHLDQLYVTACRLYHDLNLTNHKYIAYQLALLYQCINRQGIPFISYKARIEQRFDEIKLATKQDTVYLEPDQIQWLQSLTLDIVMQVTDKSSIIKCGQIFAIVHQVTSNTV